MENISLLFKILVEIWPFEEHFLLGSPSESVPRQELYPLEDETGPEVFGETAPKGGYGFAFGGAPRHLAFYAGDQVWAVCKEQNRTKQKRNFSIKSCRDFSQQYLTTKDIKRVDLMWLKN